MSFFDDASDEGVPRYDGEPACPSTPSTAASPSNAGTRPPSLLVRTASEKAQLLQFRTQTGELPALPKAAEVEAWRRQNERGQDVEPEHLDRQLSSLLRIRDDTTSVGLETMTDAEIAQHHFKLAQQHLQAAQRLALAAATAPPLSATTPSVAPSSSGSATSRTRPPLQGPFAEDAPAVESFRAAAAADRRDERKSAMGRRVSDTTERDAVVRPLMPTVHSYPADRQTDLSPLSLPSQSRIPAISSTDRKSAEWRPETATEPISTLPSRTPSSSATGRSSSRPISPPHRTATSSTLSSAPPASPGSLAAALYGGAVPTFSLPHSAQGDRDQRPLSPVSLNSSGQPAREVQARRAWATGAGSESAFPNSPLEYRSDGQPPSGTFDSETASALEVEDWDDARSEFYGAESVFSHVTRATLPGYEDALQHVPPVPSIPGRYFQAMLEAPGTGAAPGRELCFAAANPPGEPHEEEIHGFRPRQTRQPGMADASQAAMGREGDYRAPELSWFPPPNLQPHAYVLSPSGQPIPIYSAAHAPAGGSSFDLSHEPAVSAVPNRASATLPIHAQPLRFEHALPYAASSNLTGGAASLGTDCSPAPTSFRQPSPSSATDAPTSRPPSAWSDSSSQAGETRSVAAGSTTAARARTRMASLRAKVPQVRFMSPDPTLLRAPRGGASGTSSSGGGGGGGGAGTGRQAQRTGSRRASNAGGAAPDAGLVEEREGESDEDRQRRQRAIQLSLGMLV
ncbi:hypothetical protein JCM8202_006148 [Rhodotorula sphaerocarpa]